MKRPLLALVIFATAPVTVSAQFAAGPDLLANTYTTGRQIFPRVAVERDGDFVVTWTAYHDGSGTGAFGQRYNATGARRGGEFLINSYTTGYQAIPVPAAGPGGDMVVVWFDDRGIQARRHDRSGNAIGAEFQVDTYTTGRQYFPDVARTPGGGFVVAWISEGSDGSGYGIAARRIDPYGAAIGDEFVVNAYRTGNRRFADVASDINGPPPNPWPSKTDSPVVPLACSYLRGAIDLNDPPSWEAARHNPLILSESEAGRDCMGRQERPAAATEEPRVGGSIPVPGHQLREQARIAPPRTNPPLPSHSRTFPAHGQ